ncbi:hypothetical protein [Pedobacter sp.]|uniref:hypothetical protein n=1 Tax=Pedobacter sp. TaxID=1411316 RepID=UPI003D7F6D70
MKKYIYQILCNLCIIASLSLMVSSCKKTEDEPAGPARVFKPGEIKVTSAATSATLSWVKPLLSTGKALTYTVDFSKDSLFSTIAFTTTVDTAGYVVTEDNIATRTPYFARVKANAIDQQPESKYNYSSKFSLTGIQLFERIRENELKETSVTLHYVKTEGLTSIKLTPATGTEVTVSLSAADAAAGVKEILNLTAGIKYSAELFSGTKSKGILTFTTLAPTNYTQIISPADNLASVIAGAANNAVIGLRAGTYDLSAASTFITQKTITLKSISGNANDTKVNFKEIDIEGTGAGIILSGIEFDGTAGAALYFINFIGSQAANASAATFTNVKVDNCIVHGATTAFMRGNRGSAVRDHKITNIEVNNSIVYNNGADGSSSYYAFHLDNMEFVALNISKSTFYNFGPGLVLASKTLNASVTPTVTIKQSTLNGFGGNSKYALLDAAANPVNFSMQSSIFANTPKSGTVNAAAIRATAAGITLSISSSNYFKLKNSLTGTTALTFGTATLTNNQSIELPWTTDTQTFELPAGSPLRSAASDATAIGDPRWAY